MVACLVSCVSYWGAFDMVGNADEWVADWVPRSMQLAYVMTGDASAPFPRLEGANPGLWRC